MKTTSHTRRITKIANRKNHANETSAQCLPHTLNDPQSGSNQTNQHSHPRNPHDLTTPPSLAALLRTPEWETCLGLMQARSPVQIEQLLQALGGSVVYLHASQWARVAQQLGRTLGEPPEQLIQPLLELAEADILRQTQDQIRMLPTIIGTILEGLNEGETRPETPKEDPQETLTETLLDNLYRQYQTWDLEEELRSRPLSPLTGTAPRLEDSSTTSSSCLSRSPTPTPLTPYEWLQPFST